MATQPVVVVGDGWSALGAVGFLAAKGVNVFWLVGSGARLLPPTVSLNHLEGAQAWSGLLESYGIELGTPEEGQFVREFRNKAFRLPLWTKAPTAEAKLETIREVLWAPEQRLMSLNEFRYSLTLKEIEDELRKRVFKCVGTNVQRVEGCPLKGFSVEDQRVVGVVLGSGEKISCEQVIYADRWNLLSGLENLPKALPFLRRRDPVGVLQVNFTHHPALKEGVGETFFAPMHREAGEKLERHFWGYLSSDGRQSVWTLCLSAEEGEDNHEIAKKLRRLKSGLDKIFAGSDIIPAGKETFISTLSDEQFRFEEEALFSEGTPVCAPFEISQLAGISIMTDGYGPAYSMQQVANGLGIALGVGPGVGPGVGLKDSDPERENVNLADSQTLQ